MRSIVIKRALFSLALTATSIFSCAARGDAADSLSVEDAVQTLVTSSSNSLADNRAHPFPRMMICSNPSDVATVTLWLLPCSWANFSMYWSAVSASFV